jgi:predicted dinucleotide-binding enzyme
MKLGFIGLGRMGFSTAANLIEAGHEVSVYNHTPDRQTAVIDRGGVLAASTGAISVALSESLASVGDWQFAAKDAGHEQPRSRVSLIKAPDRGGVESASA